jgi:hypothetical protein
MWVKDARRIEHQGKKRRLSPREKGTSSGLCSPRGDERKIEKENLEYRGSVIQPEGSVNQAFRNIESQ